MMPELHMTSPRLTIPPPQDDDHEDVAWALRAASAQWRREAQSDAIAWVRRAAETAEEVGELHRSVELSELADALASGDVNSIPVPPVAESSVTDVELEVDVDLDEDDEDIVELEADDVDIVADDEFIEFDEAEDEDDEVESNAPSTQALPERSVPPVGPSGRPLPVPSSLPSPARATGVPRPGRPTPRPPNAPLPPLHAPAAEPAAPVDAIDELLATSAAAGPRPDAAVSSPARAVSPIGRASAPELDVTEGSLDDFDLDGVEAPAPDFEVEDESRRTIADEGDFEEDEAPTSVQPVSPVSERDLGQFGRSTQPEVRRSLHQRTAREAHSVRTLPEPPEERGLPPEEAGTDPQRPVEPFLQAPSVDMPPVRPVEPFLHAPSADMPPVAPADRPRVTVSTAPSMVAEEPPAAPPAVQPAPPSAPAAPEPDLEAFERAFGSLTEPPPASPAEEPAVAESIGIVDGVSLADVRGFEDLPEDAQGELAHGAVASSLASGEEIGNFGVALVTRGSVALMPAVADASCARAGRGDVIFTRGTIEAAVALRVVASEDDTRVATWSSEDLERAMRPCPWVVDELAEVADEFQALAGAVMGPLGYRLDDTMRGMVLEKCSVRSLFEGDVLFEKGQAVDGMYIVGAGRIELLDDDGSVVEEKGPGDFLFAQTVLMQGGASRKAVAGHGGTLLLYAGRMAAHELLATCPPLIEILAS